MMVGRRKSNITDNLTKNLFAYFPYDIDANDVIGGIVPIQEQFTFVGGVNGNAANFNSANKDLIYYDGTPFTFTDGTQDKPFGISFFLNKSDTNDMSIISKRDSQDSKLEWQLFYYNNKLSFTLYNQNSTSSYLRVATDDLPIGKDTHLIVTYNGNPNSEGYLLYINGQIPIHINQTIVGSYTSMAATSSRLAIANPVWSGGYNLTGKIDGLGFWKEFINSDKAMKIYQKQLTGELV